MTQHETLVEVARVSPAAGGAAYATVTANEVVAWITGVYVIINLLYVLRKWHLMEKRKPDEQSRF